MSEKINFKTIGKNIKAARAKKGITQDELSNLVEASTSYISEIETGNANPSLTILINIARVLDTTVDCLLGDIQANVNEEYVLRAKDILADCSDDERKFLLDCMEHIKEDHRNDFKSI